MVPSTGVPVPLDLKFQPFVEDKGQCTYVLPCSFMGYVPRSPFKSKCKVNHKCLPGPGHHLSGRRWFLHLFVCVCVCGNGLHPCLAIWHMHHALKFCTLVSLFPEMLVYDRLAGKELVLTSPLLIPLLISYRLRTAEAAGENRYSNG